MNLHFVDGAAAREEVTVPSFRCLSIIDGLGANCAIRVRR